MTELAREEASVVSRRTFLASAVAATGCGAARSLFSYRDYFSAADDTKRFTIKKKIAVVEAPLNLGLRPPHPGHEPGVRLLARKLTAYGLPKAVGADKTILVDPPAYEYKTDPGDGVKNAKPIYAYSMKLAAAVGAVLDAGRFPLVLGGDCSILLGDLLALRRRGRYGLVYLDAHSDTDLPTSDHLTAGAGSDVAVATGNGVSALTNLDGKKPLVRAEDTVLFGYLEYLEIKGAPITAIPLDQVRKHGIKEQVASALSLLRCHQVGGFWIHLDADVLDGASMPAVDSPHEDGMSWEELRQTLIALLSSGLASGMEVTIYDPDLDPTGEMGRKFTNTIISAFTSSVSRENEVDSEKGET